MSARGFVRVWSTVSIPEGEIAHLRPRRPDYRDAELSAWPEKVRAQPWEEAHVFFKHEYAGAGPRLAARFRDLFGDD